MSGGMGLFQMLVLGVVALGLLGVLTLGVYLMARNPSPGSDRKANQ